jgi:N-acyl-L-homoserine lactone synthetase
VVLDGSIEGFREYGYRVSWNLTVAEQRKVSELRADVFCRELGWTGSRDDRTEHDEFDDGSTHIAVFDEHSELIGAVRITRAAAPWMLDTVFAELAPATRIKKSVDTAESSRLAVSRKWRGKRVANGMRACDVIYRAAYLYCRVNAIRQLYLVTSDIVLAHMQRAGLPCEALTAPHVMPDGVRALTVVIDWDRLRETATFDRWFPPSPRPRPQPRPTAAVALSSAA